MRRTDWVRRIESYPNTHALGEEVQNRGVYAEEHFNYSASWDTWGELDACGSDQQDRDSGEPDSRKQWSADVYKLLRSMPRSRWQGKRSGCIRHEVASQRFNFANA
jgi:hypothetical protein